MLAFSGGQASSAMVHLVREVSLHRSAQFNKAVFIMPISRPALSSFHSIIFSYFIAGMAAIVFPPMLPWQFAMTQCVVHAVPYGAPFSHLFTELKISPIEVHISAIDSNSIADMCTSIQ